MAGHFRADFRQVERPGGLTAVVILMVTAQIHKEVAFGCTLKTPTKALCGYRSNVKPYAFQGDFCPYDLKAWHFT